MRLPCPPACPSNRRAAGLSSPSRSATSAPTTRPVLPRTSSAASGLRFCGMIEEPVEKASLSLTKPNCGVVHRTISSAKRDRCVAEIAAAAKASRAKSRSATLSSELAVGRSKPSALAVISRSIGNDVPASAAAPSGHSLRRLRASAEAAGVARQHLDIGEQMVAEGDRLGRLEMGEARHHHAGASSARAASARWSSAISRISASIASRTQRRKSTATWSLRERAVCSRRPPGRRSRRAGSRRSYGCLRERARRRRFPPRFRP